MKKHIPKAAVVAGLVLLGVLFALYFVHPLAPLFLLLSLLIQLPIVWGITRYSFQSSYRDRAYARREAYKEDGDAVKWVEAEEAETVSVGYRYWSSAGRALSALNRAEALLAAGRKRDGERLIRDIDIRRLSQHDSKRLQELELYAKGAETILFPKME